MKNKTEDEILHEIFVHRYGNIDICPKCKKKTKFHKVKNTKTYICQYCSYNLSPLANTIFHKSSTPLSKWFKAIFLFKQSNGNVSSKELERMLGVTYKTAWRIKQQSKKLFADKNNFIHNLTAQL